MSATHEVVKDDDLGWTEIVIKAFNTPIIYKVLCDKEDFVKDKHMDTVDIINKDLVGAKKWCIMIQSISKCFHT